MKIESNRTAEDMTNAAGEKVKDCVDAGVDASVTALNTVAGKAREVVVRTDSYVHENPWLVIGATAGAAAGLGVLVGFLLRSRRDS